MDIATRRSPPGTRWKAGAAGRSVSNVHVSSDVAPAEMAIDDKEMDATATNAEVKGKNDAVTPSPSTSIRNIGVSRDGEKGGGSGAKVEREFLDFGKRVRMLNLEVQDLNPTEFDLICDVRSPSEFEEDHLPGAINCPVLSDEERAEVGTMYKQVNSFEARRLGAALVAANVAKMMHRHFLQLGNGSRILVYCWRGGERSGSFAMVLSRVGWPVTTVKGGYKEYRTQVRNYLDAQLGAFQLQVVSGRTGSGKGLLLDALSSVGAQVVDLEGLANHRGSILGDLPGQPQPTQKLFESRIWAAFQNFSAARPVYLEWESNRLGRLRLPESLVDSMRWAPLIEVAVPLDVRVQHILSGYAHFTTPSGAALLEEKLEKIRPIRGHKVVQKWTDLIHRGLGGVVDAWPEFVESILVEHYDPGYHAAMVRDRSRGKKRDGRMGGGAASKVSDGGGRRERGGRERSVGGDAVVISSEGFDLGGVGNEVESTQEWVSPGGTQSSSDDEGGEGGEPQETECEEVSRNVPRGANGKMGEDLGVEGGGDGGLSAGRVLGATTKVDLVDLTGATLLHVATQLFSDYG